MAWLVLETPDGERRFELSKPVTSIGRDYECDVRIDARTIAPKHAHLIEADDGLRIMAVGTSPLSVDGVAGSEFVLEDGSRVQMGEVSARYHLNAEPKARGGSSRRDSSERIRLEAFRKLFAFSAKINASPNVETLEATLVDALIELADADAGFMLLFDTSGELAIETARSKSGENLAHDGAPLSDSILQEVLETRRPVLLSNAQDSAFAESASVINFEIQSVVAVPIVLDQACLGVLYLGANRIAEDFNEDFLEVLMVFAAQAGLLVQNARLISELRLDNEALKEELHRARFGEIVGGCAEMQRVFKMITRLAPADISVLVRGETGTGKELIARELHRRSARADGPFVAINVAAIPETLLESELFGYVKGAFTGAVSDRTGKLLSADGGTLFLDEIGDMPLTLQAKLLRVLQERAVEPVGSNRARPIDIRLVCATHRDLEAMQKSGEFRSDLYFRINESTVVLPALRERGDDIALLARFFLGRLTEGREGGDPISFSKDALAGMRRYRWPGNVRELEAKVKNAVVLVEGPKIKLDDLGLSEDALEQILPLKEAKEKFAREYVLEVLSLNEDNRSKTARELGIDPRTVYKYVEGR